METAIYACMTEHSLLVGYILIKKKKSFPGRQDNENKDIMVEYDTLFPEKAMDNPFSNSSH